MEMNGLAIVFIVKILFTVFIWCISLLFFPSKRFVCLGILEPINMVFLRLLGMAYAALVVGYVFGLVAALHGEYPIQTILVGIVSNGGAFLILLIYGLLNAWRSWGLYVRIVMWMSVLATGVITLGLVLTGFWLRV